MSDIAARQSRAKSCREQVQQKSVTESTSSLVRLFRLAFSVLSSTDGYNAKVTSAVP